MTAEEVAHACGPDTKHCSCVPHLRAEIKRLRAQRILSNEDFARAFDLGLAAGEKRERAAVVAWLREWARPTDGYYDMSVRWSVVMEAADIIERGEHRCKEKP